MIEDLIIFGKHISWYNIMALIGIIICLFYVLYVCKKRKVNDYEVVEILLIGLIGVFIGGHLLYAITKTDLIIKFITNIHKVNSFKLFIACMHEIFGGAVFYGGLIGGMISSYIYIKKRNSDIKIVSDLCAPVIPLFHMFGRIGCFLTGCCYGMESKIGFIYKHSIIESANGVNRFPIQLLESFYNLILFILLYKFYKNNKFAGKLIFIYLILYSIGRFIFEFLRGDSYRGFIFGISTSQLISILLLLFSLIIFFRKNKKIVNDN